MSESSTPPGPMSTTSRDESAMSKKVASPIVSFVASVNKGPNVPSV